MATTRNVISLSYSPDQYPLFAQFINDAPTSHRSARICEIMEAHLAGQAALGPTLEHLRDGLDRVETMLEQGIAVQSRQSDPANLPDDVVNALLSLAQEDDDA